MSKAAAADAANSGYGKLVPVDRQKHMGLSVDSEKCRQFASTLNIVVINMVEIFHAQRDYAIAFTNINNDTYVPCVITGLKKGQNLFADTESLWDPACYVPASVRRYPFVTSIVRDEKDTQQEQQVVLVDEDALVKGDNPLFDADGEATETWNVMEKFISECVTAEKRTRQFSDKLQQLGLLESFETHVHPKTADQVRLTGLYRVNEDKLNELSGDVIKELMQSGELSRIYAHLISLENFAKLLDRSARSQQ